MTTDTILVIIAMAMFGIGVALLITARQIHKEHNRKYGSLFPKKK